MLSRLAFRLSFRGRRLTVEVKHAQATYALVDGTPLEIVHHGERVTLAPGEPVSLPIPAAPKLERPRQPPGRAPGRRHPDR